MFSDAERDAKEAKLRATDVAQPALGAVSLGAREVLAGFGIRGEAFAGHSYGELTALYENLGDGIFDDVTRVTGAGARTYPYVNWGTELVDFDNDGDRDLFIANGHFEREAKKIADSATFLSPNILLMNNVAHLKIMTLPYVAPNRSLTRRQREALQWVGDGKTTQDIAILMGLPMETVEKHLRLAREALSVETTAQAVLKAALHNQMFIMEA